MPAPKVLTPDQVEQFIEEGYTYLRGGFPREFAEPVLKQVWDLLPEGTKRDDPTTWKQETMGTRGGPKGPEVAALYTPRVRAAFDDVTGEGRWVERGERTGAWPVIFPGFAQKPWAPNNGWHVDGGGQRRVNGPQQALIAIMLFSDIGPGDGGTAIRPGSHKIAARLLHEAEPNGLTTGELNHLAPKHSEHITPVEAQGEIGDLVICHGYIVHSGSRNTGTKPRIITNNCIALKEPMVFDRPNRDDLSPVERAIADAIQQVR